VEPAGYYHVYNQFTIRTQQRDSLKKHLRQDGILTEIYYPYPLHLEPAFTSLGCKRGDFPACEKACSEVLSLPIFPELNDKQLRAVVQAVASFCTEQYERKPEVCNGAS